MPLDPALPGDSPRASVDGLAALGIGAEQALAQWRLVLVLVGEFDLRTTAVLAYSWCIPAQERRAVHVTTDEAQAWRLAEAWMGSRLPYQLFMVEDEGGVPATVRRMVQCELDSAFDEVVVLVGRMGLRSWWGRLLHDRTADAVQTALSGMSGVVPAVMTVATV